jgi:hypothetical protein
VTRIRQPDARDSAKAATPPGFIRQEQSSAFDLLQQGVKAVDCTLRARVRVSKM